MHLSLSLKVAVWSIAGVIGLAVCAQAAVSHPAAETPEWAKKAIWYQIFVERFRNGDPSNDPTLRDMKGSWPHAEPPGWKPTLWTHDWYKQEDWAAETEHDFYYTVQLRRYGGDLQGVLDKLDYLQDLGVNAIYFNPLNDAPSLHKYDARNYRHIDRNFGPDPGGDEALIAREDPTDPATWEWTAADRLFLELVSEIHRRDMRVIMDYSWSHTGMTFWAWKDVLRRQDRSRFADWYQIKCFDDQSTREDEFDYEGWAGVRELPNLTKTGVPEGYHSGPTDGDLHPEVKRHVLAVTQRWLDPNDDGDPSDGVDGFRLDVAEMVPLGFWRDYRTYVKAINPDAYLVGEIWWEQWPHTMMDPRPYLGDAFDGVMNYRWYMPTRSFFADAPPHLNATSYVAHLNAVEEGIAEENLLAVMNVAATHDSPRLATSIYNPGEYKAGVTPRDNPNYKINRPDTTTRAIQRMILVQQFTYYGAPHIWYGDEVGMWGADDPDNRKPMVWADYKYQDEAHGPFGLRAHPDPVRPDCELLAFYRKLISMRKQCMDLFVSGALAYVIVDDDAGLLGYTRTRPEKEAVVLFNTADVAHTITLSVDRDEYVNALETGTTYRATGGVLTVELAPQTAAVLITR
jgi:glycosidase